MLLALNLITNIFLQSCVQVFWHLGGHQSLGCSVPVLGVVQFYGEVGVSVSLASNYHTQSKKQGEYANQEIGFLSCSAQRTSGLGLVSPRVEYSQNRCLEQVENPNKQLIKQHRGETPAQSNPGDWVWLATREIKGLPGCRNINAHYNLMYKLPQTPFLSSHYKPALAPAHLPTDYADLSHITHAREDIGTFHTHTVCKAITHM